MEPAEGLTESAQGMGLPPEIKSYRKKPVVTMAVQFEGWLTPAIDYFVYGNTSRTESLPASALRIQTPSGVVFASVGDYIVKDVNGCCYPCIASVFEQTYEPA